MNTHSIVWGAKVSRDFLAGVKALCDALAWGPSHAEWLMACIAFESGETFSPSVRNAAGSGATGLIQFMPATARDLGTSTDGLAEMSAVDQLSAVREYFRPYARRVASLSDMYMAILLPTAVGKPDDAKLFWEGAAYRQNAGLDANHDGVITKAEATAKVAAKLARGAAYSASIDW